MIKQSENDFSNFACKDKDAVRLKPLQDEQEGGLSIRSPYCRDRDWILFTRGFRALSLKTQVYLTSEANPAQEECTRTRLTHTLEVANIAKTICTLLGLNCGLVESMAYGHDIGHPPFGHAGEEQLNLLLNGKMPLPRYVKDCLDLDTCEKADNSGKRDYGDFKHNFQSVRQLTFLFSYDHLTEGLNLTLQSLEGILKHTGLKSKLKPEKNCKYPGGPEKLFEKLIENRGFSPTLEAKVLELADEIAQVCHDLNDAIELGAIPLNEFVKREDVKAAKGYAQNHGKNVVIELDKTHDDTNNIVICSALVEYFTRNTYEKISQILKEQGENTQIKDFIDKLPNTPEPSDDFGTLQEFKDNLVVNNYNMNRMDNKGKFVIRKLIDAYLCDPRQLPDMVLRRYCKIKSKEYSLRGSDYIKEWFGKIEDTFGVKENRKISEEDVGKIIDLIQKDFEGTVFRKIDSNLVCQLKPYLALDADYLRTVVDHIATMTDVSAEKEMIALYGH